MMKRIFLFLIAMAMLVACNDNDSFTASPSARLTFSTDTVKLDTVFSTIGSATYTLWVYNNASDGIKIKSVRLRQGNQTGFRVNVDGSYLDNTLGSVVNNLEVRKGDSLRVFVEITAPENMQELPKTIEDDLIFALESGVEQRVCLHGCAWDALQLRNLVVSHDTLIQSFKPIIIYGGIKVDNTTLYFHDQAGIDVYGTLSTDSVLMRGDRLDHMFSYLPYDRVSGQWRGLQFHSSSFGNTLINTEIRNAEDAIVCDSSSLDSQHRRLYMERCIVHNNKGVGLEANNAYVGLLNCQFSNTLKECVAVYGGAVIMHNCTLAQFYPFSADRGPALRFCNFKGENNYPLEAFTCINSIITGYADDVIMGEMASDSTVTYNFYFENCLLRTPQPEEADTISFVNVLWETPKDSVQGKQHFRLIDEDNLQYDFHLDSLSTAKGMGCYPL